VLGELFGREFAGLDVAFVEFRILLPFFGQVVQGKNCGHRADGNAGAAIDAFHRVNVELGNVVEGWATVVVGGVFLGVDAIHGTGVDAGGVFCSDAGFGNDIGHGPPSPCQDLRYACSGEDSSVEEVNSSRMAPAIERISAVALRVANMAESVRFYRDVLGMELLHGGEEAGFSSLRAKDAQSAILNLEQGDRATRWGRLIFYVTDVDALWTRLKDRGFNPEIPRDASWGERDFHMPDPDGHELSFARPLQ
jgi:catechol 2,3-dioxygenase-like lactoylglutathione lyase family enzyme